MTPARIERPPCARPGRRAYCWPVLAGLAFCGSALAASPYRLDIATDDYRLAADRPAAQNRATALPTAPGRQASGLSRLVDRHAVAHGLDPALVHAVVRAESAYQPEALSPKGAIGLMQVMPDTGRRFGVANLRDPDANLRAGTAYLSYLLHRFSDLPLALAAYNAGEGAVLRHGLNIPPYPETRAYVRGILRSYGQRGQPPLAAAPAKAAAKRSYIAGAWLEDAQDLSAYRLQFSLGEIPP